MTKMLVMKLMSRKYRAEAEDGGEDLGGTEAAEVVVEDTATDEESGVNDWAELAEDDDVVPASDEGVGVDEPPTPEADATDDTKPEVKTEVAAEPEAQPQTTEQKAEQPTAEVQPPAAEQPAQQAPAEYTREQIAKMRSDYQDELTKFYTLSPEDAERFQTEPETVLPVLAAKVHLDVLDAVMAQLPQRVGALIQQTTAAERREAEAEREFFAPFPDLQPYKAQVLQVGRMFRAANPKATKEEAIQMIGSIVRQSLGLPAPNAAPAPSTPPINQAANFKPAQSAGQGNIPEPKSLWEEMAEPDD